MMHCERLLELVHPMIKMYSAAGGCLSISAAARAWQLGDVRRNASSPRCGSFCQIDIDVRGSQFFVLGLLNINCVKGTSAIPGEDARSSDSGQAQGNALSRRGMQVGMKITSAPR
jgi:hypothetical protein